MYHTYFLLAMKIMALMGLVVFVALYFVDAGYGNSAATNGDTASATSGGGS